MINDFNRISEADAAGMTKEQLISMYNDAVETIWALEESIRELRDENEDVWDAYDEICNKYFG